MVVEGTLAPVGIQRLYILVCLLGKRTACIGRADTN